MGWDGRGWEFRGSGEHPSHVLLTKCKGTTSQTAMRRSPRQKEFSLPWGSAQCCLTGLERPGSQETWKCVDWDQMMDTGCIRIQIRNGHGISPPCREGVRSSHKLFTILHHHAVADVPFRVQPQFQNNFKSNSRAISRQKQKAKQGCDPRYSPCIRRASASLWEYGPGVETTYRRQRRGRRELRGRRSGICTRSPRQNQLWRLGGPTEALLCYAPGPTPSLPPCSLASRDIFPLHHVAFPPCITWHFPRREKTEDKGKGSTRSTLPVH